MPGNYNSVKSAFTLGQRKRVLGKDGKLIGLIIMLAQGLFAFFHMGVHLPFFFVACSSTFKGATEWNLQVLVM